MRELALEHAAARLDEAEYLARMARLRGELEIVGAQPARDLPAQRALEWLDTLTETWQNTELVEQESDVIHAIYERIVIEGPRFVGLRLSLPPTATASPWRCQMLLWRARQVSDAR